MNKIITTLIALFLFAMSAIVCVNWLITREVNTSAALALAFMYLGWNLFNLAYENGRKNSQQKQ
jgi:hypothetical protein